jgi:APA family basic amino acid/polyamine antiporter
VSIFRTKNLDAMVAASSAAASTPGGLKKVLGPFDLVLMGIGAIVGTGIFVLTGTGAVTAGPALTLSFAIAALACAFAALCYAEFASTVPVAGSIYTYSYATLGELVAWMIGWDLLLEYGLATSTVAVGWSGYFQSLLTGFGMELPAALRAAPGAIPGVATMFNLPAFLIMLVLTGLLSLGVRESARWTNIMVLIKTTVVLLFIFVGFKHVQPANWQPFMPYGMGGVMSAAALVFFAFIGFDARPADRDHRLAGDLHGPVRCRGGHHDRHRAIQEFPRRGPSGIAGAAVRG